MQSPLHCSGSARLRFQGRPWIAAVAGTVSGRGGGVATKGGWTRRYIGLNAPVLISTQGYALMVGLALHSDSR